MCSISGPQTAFLVVCVCVCSEVNLDVTAYVLLLAGMRSVVQRLLCAMHIIYMLLHVYIHTYSVHTYIHTYTHTCILFIVVQLNVERLELNYLQKSLTITVRTIYNFYLYTLEVMESHTHTACAYININLLLKLTFTYRHTDNHLLLLLFCIYNRSFEEHSDS